jgi:hypothetical protein
VLIRTAAHPAAAKVTSRAANQGGQYAGGQYAGGKCAGGAELEMLESFDGEAGCCVAAGWG